MERNGYDLVLMDCSMPVMDGFAATLEIRRAEEFRCVPRTPVVALTARVLGQDDDAWRKAGMDAFLIKPFTLEGIARTLADWLEPTAPVVQTARRDGRRGTVSGPRRRSATPRAIPVVAAHDPPRTGDRRNRSRRSDRRHRHRRTTRHRRRRAVPERPNCWSA